MVNELTSSSSSCDLGFTTYLARLARYNVDSGNITLNGEIYKSFTISMGNSLLGINWNPEITFKS